MKIIVDLNDPNDVHHALAMMSAVTIANDAGNGDYDSDTGEVYPAAPGPIIVSQQTSPQTDPRIGVALDSTGAPWNEAVHATTKGTNKDGSWKAKRGVDDATRAAVEAADKARLAGTPMVPVMGAVTVSNLPSTLAPLPPNTPILEPISYDQLLKLYSEMSAENKIDVAKLNDLCAKHGVTVNEMPTNETARRLLWDELCDINRAPQPVFGLPGGFPAA